MMLVFFKAGLVFLSVPKTGSTAYHAALRDHADVVISAPPELKHAPVYRFNRFVLPMFKAVIAKDLDIMAVVSEPVRWLRSWYRYRQRPDLAGHANSTEGMSFDSFVEAYLQSEPPPFARVGRQSRFLGAGEHGSPATHLFRYDDQEGLNAFLTDRLGVSIALARKNVSPIVDASLTEENLARLQHDCAADFELYNRIRPFSM